MGCTIGISHTITSNCTTVGTGGVEVRAWALNRSDVASLTMSSTTGEENVITAITMTGATVAYKILGIKKLIDFGHDAVVAESRPDLYKQYLKFEGFEQTPIAITGMDALSDLIVIVELKDKQTTGKGTFVVLGATHGLFKTSDTLRSNSANGARQLELTSLDGQEEPYSRNVFWDTSYATSLAALIALET